MTELSANIGHTTRHEQPGSVGLRAQLLDDPPVLGVPDVEVADREETPGCRWRAGH